MPQIKLENVTVNYKNKKVINKGIDDLSCTFESDTFNCIIGYSGCGKTTLLKAISGLQDYEGKVYIGGVDADNIDVKDRNLSYVYQEYVLYPHLTIFDNIAFSLKILGAPKNEIIERVYKIAETLDLTSCLTRKPKHLSGGQQQRVAIARALVKNPSICLFDEPFSNLDEKLRVEARQYLKKALKGMMCTTIFVTHNITEAMALSDKLYVMNDGKVELSGDPLDVYNSDNEIVKSLIGDVSNDTL